MLRLRLFAVFTVIRADYYRCLECTSPLGRRTARLPSAQERTIRQRDS